MAQNNDKDSVTVTLDKKVIRAIVMAVVMGAVPASTGVSMLLPSRSDLFTGSDGKHMREEIEKELSDLRSEYAEYRRVNNDRIVVLEQRLSYFREKLTDLEKR